MASVTGQGDRIVITPFDPSNVPAVVKALSDAKLNAYALNPRTVCVGVPPVSGEQRAELARHVKKLGEEAKVAVRSIRQDARKQIAARGKGLGACRAGGHRRRRLRDRVAPEGEAGGTRGLKRP